MTALWNAGAHLPSDVACYVTNRESLPDQFVPYEGIGYSQCGRKVLIVIHFRTFYLTLLWLNTKRRPLYLKTQSVPRSKHSVSATKTSQLMLYREITVACAQIHTKHTNTLCGQNVELLMVTCEAKELTIPRHIYVSRTGSAIVYINNESITNIQTSLPFRQPSCFVFGNCLLPNLGPCIYISENFKADHDYFRSYTFQFITSSSYHLTTYSLTHWQRCEINHK